MNKNFKIGQSNELIKNGRIYDLHNCFDFEGFIKSDNDSFQLKFKPNAMYGTGYSSVTIEAKSTDYVELSAHFDDTSELYLEEMGYKFRADKDGNWLLSESQSTAEDDLFFRFNDGHFVRFHCESVNFSEVGNP